MLFFIVHSMIFISNAIVLAAIGGAISRGKHVVVAVIETDLTAV